MLAFPSSPASGAPKGEQRVAVVELENNSKLGAHYLISGSVTQLGNKLNLALKVHHTRSSKLLGRREESASSLDQFKERILPRVSRGAS